MSRNALRVVLLLLSILCIYSTTRGILLGIHFAREKVYLSIFEDHILVRGHYFFINERGKPTKAKIVYPFPIDSTMFFPDSIRVSQVGEGGTEVLIPYRIREKSIDFGIELPPGSSREIVTRYRQEVRGSVARYILTSTRSWGRALEEAEFFIDVPDHLEIESLSYDAFSLWRSDGKQVYYMRRENFLPDVDLIVSWKKKL